MNSSTSKDGELTAFQIWSYRRRSQARDESMNSSTSKDGELTAFQIWSYRRRSQARDESMNSSSCVREMHAW